jgi:transposase
MVKFSVPPGYVRKKPPARPKLDAKRIFERLRDEYDFTGGITIVKDYVASRHRRAQEMFVPLVHPPGHAQVDFGEAI